jgi:peptide chain release factor 1
MWDKLADIEKRYEELAREMARPEVAADFQQMQALAKEHASLESIVSLYREYKRVDAALTEAHSLAGESPDRELAAMARDEATQLAQERQRRTAGDHGDPGRRRRRRGCPLRRRSLSHVQPLC